MCDPAEFFSHKRVYCGQTALVSTTQVTKTVHEITENIYKKMDHQNMWLMDSAKCPKKEAVPTIYVGISGVAMMHYHIYTKMCGYEQGKEEEHTKLGVAFQCRLHLKRAADLLEKIRTTALPPDATTEQLAKHGIGFYCGVTGFYALKAAVHIAAADSNSANACAQEVFKFASIATRKDTPAEVLYGKAGYLYCLMFVMKHGIPLPTALLQSVIASIIEAGQEYATEEYPLLWYFFGTAYLGAAHGAVGILYMLLCCWDDLTTEQKVIVEKAVHKLCEKLNSPSRGLPVTAKSGDEILHHWCHGFPGAVTLLAKAYLLFQDPKFLAAAKWCGTVIYEEGLLRKGIGLCHGALGNAYAFLTLYRLTNDYGYLFKAASFYEECEINQNYLASVASYEDPQRIMQGIPDTPHSLMEGKAGVCCFLVDLLHPEFSNFPGYETSKAPPAMDWIDRRYYPLCLPVSSNLYRKLLPGAYVVPVMDPSFCQTLLDRIYGTVNENHKNTDAIRLTSEFQPIVSGITAVVQRFAENVMLPEEPRRLKTRLGRKTEEGGELGVVKEQTLPGMWGSPCGSTATILTDDSDIFYEVASAKTRGESRKAAASKLLNAAQQQEMKETPSTIILQKEKKITEQNDFVPRLRAWRAYVIRYDLAHHPSIQSHIDSCDVTFNLCLNRSTTKGHLVYNASGQHYRHVVGEAAIFWGDIVHHTHTVGPSGERAQLVILFNFMRPQISKLSKYEGIVSAKPFPQEVLGVVFGFLPLCDLACVMYACSTFGEIANDNDFWRDRYKDSELERFHPSADLVTPPVCHLCQKRSKTGEPIFHCEAVGCQRHQHWNCKEESFPHEEMGCFDNPFDRKKVCDICKANPPKEAENADDSILVPASQEYTQKSRLRNYFRLQVEHGGSWKQTYREVRIKAAMVEEAVRSARKLERQRFFMAIIGCYPVHNLRQTLRVPEHDKEEKDKEFDDFELCDECRKEGTFNMDDDDYDEMEFEST